MLVDNQLVAVDSFERLERFKEHNIDVIVGEVTKEPSPEETLEMVETALRIGKRPLRIFDQDHRLQLANTEMEHPNTGRSFEELATRLFS